jgi:LysM repeat protein
MEFKQYKIQKKDTLQSIAEKQKMSVKELVHFHNSFCTITQLITGEHLPIHLEYLFVQPEALRESCKKENTDLKEFEGKTRYRCEQINTSKMNGSLVHFLQQNFQYLVKSNFSNNKFYVELEDHHFEFNPTYLNPSFAFISKTEFIKNRIFFQISEDNGRLSEIHNKKEMNENWQKFKKNEFYNDEFIIQLLKTNIHAVNELLTMGDRQFAEDYPLMEEEYRRNLLYFTLFDKVLVKDIKNIEKEQFDFMSTIVPPVVVPIEFRYDTISEEDHIINFRKVGIAKLDEKIISEIKQKYDEIHKPSIKYNYTEYKLEFRVRGEFNKEKKIIENADLFIIEQIADNIENRCEFHLKKMHNYTT